MPNNAETGAGVSMELLPPLLREFVALIGLPATMNLVRHYGGVRIYIPTPERCTEDHYLAWIIGLNNLKALGETFGGVPHFQLPKAEKALLAIRNAQIIAEKGNLSAREIALKYRLTEDHVRRILTKAAAEEQHRSAQPNLF